MKLKNQFLRLFALLGLSMAATSAWAGEIPADPAPELKCDANGSNCYVNMPTPSSSGYVYGSVAIPSNVKTFKVYDDGGADQPFTSFSGTGAACGVRLLLTAPAGSAFKVSGKLYGAATGQRPYVTVVDGNVLSNSTNDYITYGHPNSASNSVFSINPNKKLSTGPNIFVELHSDGGSSGTNSDGLDMTVEVIPGTLVINTSGSGSYEVSSAAGQFDLQIPAGAVNNTTTLTAPAGYVLYVEGGIAVPSGSSVTAYDGANTSANQLFATTGASNTEGALSSTNNVTLQVATTGSGFAEAQTVTVHVLKKTTTTAADYYAQDDGNFTVATIKNVETGTVSFSGVTVNAVELEREFSMNTPATIVLPFQLPDGATTNAKFYVLKNVEQVNHAWVANMTKIKTVPQANTPYVVVIPNDTRLKFGNYSSVTLQTGSIATQWSNLDSKWYFTGSYTYRAWAQNDAVLGLAYGFAGPNEPEACEGCFGRMGSGSSIAPMRAYLSKANPGVALSRPLAKGEVSSIENLPESIDVNFIDEEEKTTAIGRMNTVTGAIKIDRWFDLKGRSTNHKPTTKGAFFNKKGIAK